MAEQELAGIYCRLSVARFGDTTKVDDQERICRDLAAARGWHVPDDYVFSDNNKSAWQRNRNRPAWNRMTELVRQGTLRRIVNYHGDRLIRQPWDLEQLLNFADQLGVVIVSPHGEYQLDVPNDRFILRILTAKACLESDDTSRRKKTGFERMARQGIAPPAGSRWGRGFGYDTSGRIIILDEATAIREAAARVLRGELLTVIAADLSSRGLQSVSGKPLDWHTLQRILLRPRVAGLLADGTPGSWEPILDRGTWEMTRATLTARAISRPAAENRRYLLSGNRRYLLSGIAECGACGGKMQRHATGPGRRRDGTRRTGHVSVGYGCVTPGCRKVHRSMAHLDAYVTGAVVARLSAPEVTAAVDAVRADPAGMEIARLEARRAEAKAVIETLADHPGQDLDLLARSLASFDQKIAELREAAQESARSRILRTHAGITRAEFGALPLEVRRSLVRACFRVIVKPASARGPGFRTEDVTLDPGNSQ